MTGAHNKNLVAVRHINFWLGHGYVNETSKKFKNPVQPMDMGNAFEDPMLDGLEVVGSVCLENAAENTMVEGIDVVRLNDAAGNPMVVMGGVNVGPGTRRVGNAAKGPMRAKGGTTFYHGTIESEGPVVVSGNVDENLVPPVGLGTAIEDRMMAGVGVVLSRTLWGLEVIL